jgi:hypothetical protein
MGKRTQTLDRGTQKICFSFKTRTFLSGLKLLNGSVPPMGFMEEPFGPSFFNEL